MNGIQPTNVFLLTNKTELTAGGKVVGLKRRTNTTVIDGSQGNGSNTRPPSTGTGLPMGIIAPMGTGVITCNHTLDPNAVNNLDLKLQTQSNPHLLPLEHVRENPN